ncbi:MAG: nuclear transport factor 2 family protein [Gammaproteobacteria bacterium]
MDSDIDDLMESTRIIDVITRLFVATDNRDWEAVKRCFAPTVLFDMSSLGAGDPQDLSPDDIVAMWDVGLKPLEAIHHQVGNFLVDVDGSKADAFCYGIASHYLPNKTGNNTRTFVGSYDVSLVKDDALWRIHKFKFNLKYLDGNRNLEAGA